MSDLIPFIRIGLYVLMGISILAAIAAVTLRSMFHAALGLIVVLMGIAGLFFALHAEFLAVVQILLYVGAVMTLVIFAIMLTENLGDKSTRQSNKQSVVALIGVIAFLGLLFGVLTRTPWPVKSATVAARIGTFELGEALLGTYVLPFEVISVVLIAALIGAIIIAKKDKEA